MNSFQKIKRENMGDVPPNGLTWGQMVWNITLLSVAYATGIIMLFGSVFASPLAGIYLTNGDAQSRLQTVPLSVLIFFSAAVIPFAGLLFQKIGGYKLVFVLSACIGCAGSAICFVSVFWGAPTVMSSVNASVIFQPEQQEETTYLWSFVVLCFGCAFMGLAYGVIHFYRHVAASELSSVSFRPWAVAIVLSGGIVAGILGPQIGSWTQDLLPNRPFAGTYVVLSGVLLLHILVVAAVRLPKPSKPSPQPPTTRADKSDARPLLGNAEDVVHVSSSGRPLFHIFATSAFARSVVPAVCFHAAMVALMSLSPVLVASAYGNAQSADVLTSHVVAMYVPSLVVPLILGRVSARILVTGGCILFVGGCAMLHFGATVHVALYYASMVSVGLGWNAAFVSSTALLPHAIESPQERFKVQAANDTIIFGVGSVVSLLAGILLKSVGIIAITVVCASVAITGTICSWVLGITFERNLQQKRTVN